MAPRIKLYVPLVKVSVVPAARVEKLLSPVKLAVPASVRWPLFTLNTGP